MDILLIIKGEALKIFLIRKYWTNGCGQAISLLQKQEKY